VRSEYRFVADWAEEPVVATFNRVVLGVVGNLIRPSDAVERRRGDRICGEGSTLQMSLVFANVTSDVRAGWWLGSAYRTLPFAVGGITTLIRSFNFALAARASFLKTAVSDGSSTSYEEPLSDQRWN